MTWFGLLIALFCLERLAELVVSRRNQEWSRQRGGIEFGAGHYPVMVVLHVGLLGGALVEVWLADRPFIPGLGWPMLALVVAAQALRWWCIASLGQQWNTQASISSDLTWTSNSDLGTSNAHDDTVLNVRPRFDMRREGARVRLAGHVALSAYAYANGSQPSRVATGSRPGSERTYVGERCSIVTWPAPAFAIAGTSVTAVAPEPMTTTFLPV